MTGRVGIGAAIARRTVITYLRSPPLTSGTLNEVFATTWPAHVARDFEPALEPFYRAAEFAPTSAGLLRLPSQRIS